MRQDNIIQKKSAGQGIGELYRLEAVQQLPISLPVAWEFFGIFSYRRSFLEEHFGSLTGEIIR